MFVCRSVDIVGAHRCVYVLYTSINMFVIFCEIAKKYSATTNARFLCWLSPRGSGWDVNVLLNWQQLFAACHISTYAAALVAAAGYWDDDA